MDGSNTGIVFLGVVVCVVAVVALIAVALTEVLRRRTWAQRFWLEAQPSSMLGLRTCHVVFADLQRACAAESRPLPVMSLMAVSDTRVQVFLTVPSEGAPAPWTSSADGMSWSALLDEVDACARGAGDDFGQRAPQVDVDAAELFVTAGQAESATVFLNLAASPGLIALLGSVRVRRQVIRRWIGELTEPAWRRDVNALVVGEPRLVSGRATTVSGTLRSDVHRDFPGGLLLLGPAREAERLDLVRERAGADGLQRFAAVVEGRGSRGAWRIEARDNGVLTSPLFPELDWRDAPEFSVEHAR